MLADDATFYLEFSILTLKGVYLIVYTLGIEINFMTRSFQTTQMLFYKQRSYWTTDEYFSPFDCFWLLIFGKKKSHDCCSWFKILVIIDSKVKVKVMW